MVVPAVLWFVNVRERKTQIEKKNKKSFKHEINWNELERDRNSRKKPLERMMIVGFREPRVFHMIFEQEYLYVNFAQKHEIAGYAWQRVISTQSSSSTLLRYSMRCAHSYIRAKVCAKLTNAHYFCAFGFLSEKYKSENDGTQINSVQ